MAHLVLASHLAAVAKRHELLSVSVGFQNFANLFHSLLVLVILFWVGFIRIIIMQRFWVGRISVGSCVVNSHCHVDVPSTLQVLCKTRTFLNHEFRENYFALRFSFRIIQHKFMIHSFLISLLHNLVNIGQKISIWFVNSIFIKPFDRKLKKGIFIRSSKNLHFFLELFEFGLRIIVHMIKFNNRNEVDANGTGVSPWVNFIWVQFFAVFGQPIIWPVERSLDNEVRVVPYFPATCFHWIKNRF